MKKISLIVPIYNTEKYLDTCIKSLINQTLKDIEIILINDGSPGNCDKIIKKYQDPRIIYIKKENEGIGKTRNLGIKTAKGKYVAFVDSDDFLQLDFCQKMYEKAEKEASDLVICNFYDLYETKKVERKFAEFNNTNIKKEPEIINKINLGPCNKIYLLKMLKKNSIYFEENLKYEDAPFVLKALINAKKISSISDYLTNYVIHDESQTTVRDEKIRDIFQICNIICDELKNKKELHNEMTCLLANIITDYTVQQRYIKSAKFRNTFIDDAFTFLDSIDKKWRKCPCFKDYNFRVRTIKKSKFLTKIYCFIYNLIK